MPRKVVVVTGANRGLGLELARHFLAAREDDRTWEVFACSRSEDPVGAIAEGGGGERVRWVKLDVRVPETVDALGRAFATHAATHAGLSATPSFASASATSAGPRPSDGPRVPAA